MNWEEAEINLRENINLNEHLAGFGHYKIVVGVPSDIHDGYRIRVGATNYINVSMGMLRVLFEESSLNNGIYNRNVFRNLFPNELANKPCYVHAIGKLFVFAGVAVQNGNRNYNLL